MTSSRSIEFLEILENSELGKKMNESEKVVYLIPIAFELARVMEEEMIVQYEKGGKYDQ